MSTVIDIFTIWANSFGPVDIALLVLSAFALLVGQRHARARILKAKGTNPATALFVQKVSANDVAPVLPFLLVSASHQFLRRLIFVLNGLFLFFVIMSWGLPLLLEPIVQRVYALNGLAAVFENGAVAGEVSSFAARLIPAIALQIAAFVPISIIFVFERLFERQLSTGKAPGFLTRLLRPSIQVPLAGLALVALIVTAFSMIPDAAPLSERLIAASTSARDMNSVLSQFLLGPFYAQVIIAYLGLIYVAVVAAALVFVLFAVLARSNAAQRAPDVLVRKAREAVVNIRTIAIGVAGGASVSFAVTLIAIMIGRQFHSGGATTDISPLPRLFFANAFFDGLTLIFTVWLVGQAVKASEGPMNRFLAAPTRSTLQGARLALGATGGLIVLLLIDILFAGAFAVGSLYFALQGTDWAVSPQGALFVLFGLSPDGNALRFDTAFWIMHTTFGPSVLFLLALLYGIVFMLVWMVVWSWLSLLWTKVTTSPLGKALSWAHILVLFAAPQLASELIERAVTPAITAILASGQYVELVNTVVELVPLP